MAMGTFTVFNALRKILVRISESPNFDNARELENLLGASTPKAIFELQDLLIGNLMKYIIDSTLKEDVRYSLLQSLHITLENAQGLKAESIIRMISLLMSLLIKVKGEFEFSNLSEELKLKILECSLGCVKQINQDILQEFYKKANAPGIAHCIYVCLSLAESEKNQEIRLISINIVRSLALVPAVGATDISDPEDRRVVGDVFAIFTPGVVSKLNRFINGPITQGSKITVAALRTLGGVIALVMEDYNWDVSQYSADTINELVKSITNECEPSESTVESDPSKIVKDFSNEREEGSMKINFKKEGTQNGINEDLDKNGVNMNESGGSGAEENEIKPKNGSGNRKDIRVEFKGRTKEWLNATAKNIAPVFNRIQKLKIHSDWRVRKEVASVSTLIISRCPKSLILFLSPLVDALMYLKGDDQPEVADFCNQSVERIIELFAARSCKSFHDLLVENLYKLLTSVPRLVQEDGGSNAASVLSLLAGYVEMLGSGLKSVLSSVSHLQRFTLAVLQTIVLDASVVSLSPDYSLRELKAENKVGLQAPWVSLVFCGSEESLRQVSRLLHALSTSENSSAFDLICRQLLAVIPAIPSVTCEGILFLNELLRAGNTNTSHHLAELALNLYLEPDMFYVNYQGSKSLFEDRRNVVKICLLTEGIGCCVKAMEQTKVKRSLQQALYPVLERAGSSNYMISKAGIEALGLLSRRDGHGENIPSFLNENIDYVSHSVSTRLRRPKEYPFVFDALTLLLRNTSEKTLPGIRDIVSDVLLRSEESKEILSEAHLRVFYNFAESVLGWLKREEPHSKDDFEMNDDDELKINIIIKETLPWQSVRLLKEYSACVLLAEEQERFHDFDRRDGETELTESEQPHVMAEQQRKEKGESEPEDEKKPPPPEVQLLDSVLRRSLNFISCSDPNLQFLAMRTVAEGMKALSDFTDILLPLGHQTWAPLVGRLHRDQPPLIFRTAFDLLCIMAETCKDFLRPRIIKEVFPELCVVLESSLKESRLKDKASAYRTTQRYKLQKSILSRSGPLCINMQLEGTDFRPLLISALPYLSCYQPRALQILCVNFVSLLKSVDADLVWWNVATMWGPESLTTALKVSPGKAEFCAETLLLLQ